MNYDRYRPSLLLDRSRAEMLLNLQAGDVRQALDALNRGIRDVEAFYAEYEMQEELGDSTERQVLVDLRRSLREKHNVPLNDDELLHSLRVEQEIAIRRENYEMAARLRDKINSLRGRSASGPGPFDRRL
jgi:excinuclease UvrABC helicase subunit UvrB